MSNQRIYEMIILPFKRRSVSLDEDLNKNSDGWD